MSNCQASFVSLNEPSIYPFLLVPSLLSFDFGTYGTVPKS